MIDVKLKELHYLKKGNTEIEQNWIQNSFTSSDTTVEVFNIGTNIL